MDKKTIGINGGMGPLATADLFQKIVVNTKADTDQQHLHMLIDNDPSVPDRTAAILHGGEDPLPVMLRAARRLEQAGADLLIMPCNTAHYYYESLAAGTSLPILHMPNETAREIARQGIGTVGLLATDATIRTGLYSRALEALGIRVLLPDDRGQSEVRHVIFDGVKAGNTQIDIAGFLRTLDELEAAGAQAMVLGCTELPVAFSLFRIRKRAVDPTAVLARAAIVAAGGQLRED
jgi:aspartate racemase